MLIYSILVLIHILSATIWVGSIPADFVLRKAINGTIETNKRNHLVQIWMKLLNLSGIVGLTGVLTSGIIMSINFGYGFFNFSSAGNHWLYTKQLITLVIIVILVTLVIPNAKKISASIKSDSEMVTFNSDIHRLMTIVNIQNALVLINFMLAILRKFIGF